MISQFLVRQRYWLRVLFWLALVLILILSLRPFHGIMQNYHYADKIEHFLAYLALGFLWGIGWSIKEPWPLLRALLTLIVLGAGIEIIQALPWIGRTASWLDLLADVVGALSGLTASMMVRRFE